MREIVFFDVDNVLVEGQSQKYLAWFMYKNNHLPPWLMIKILGAFFLYKLRMLKDFGALRLEALKSLRGLDQKHVEKLFQQFYETTLKSKIRHEAVEEIRKHKDAGHEVVLLSASLHEIVDRIKVDLGLKYQISTKLECLNGIYTGKVEGDVVYGQNKTKAALLFIRSHGLDGCPVHAYADHSSDMELLQKVKYPHAVNPDKELLLHAHQYGWAIHIWKNPNV